VVGVDLDVTRASDDTIDQHVADAECTHFAEGDLLFVGTDSSHAFVSRGVTCLTSTCAAPVHDVAGLKGAKP